MKILVVDNYDSFTYNLVDRLRFLSGGEVVVMLNDKVSTEMAAEYDKIVFSPGPGLPSGAGNMKKIIADLAISKSMLGVCLGHQAIAEVFGGNLVNPREVFHGISTPLKFVDRDSPLLKGINPGDEVGRYHSWVVDSLDPPVNFKVIATDENDIIMAMSHLNYPVHSVQFHPESVLTPCGDILIQNWLSL